LNRAASSTGGRRGFDYLTTSRKEPFMPLQNPSDLPFTLVCIRCDAGMDIESHEQARTAGSTDIEFARDLPMANYCGLCPDCCQAEEDG
jgi:hypothetical protein